MRIIDVHTHIFPDKLALKASQYVGTYYSLAMSADGTLTKLIEGGSGVMQGNELIYVISSAATKSENVRHGNDFLLDIASKDKRFVALGSVHPDMGAVEAVKQLQYIKEHDARGIKLHPDFQRFYIDTPEMFPVYEACAELELPILFHVGDENTDYSTPTRLYNVINKFPKLKAIAAHMGGYMAWNESERVLYGTNVYMDTSDALIHLSPEHVMEQIERHGVDKIMFGSDYPLKTTTEAYEKFNALPLTDLQRERIYHGTAEELFCIK